MKKALHKLSTALLALLSLGALAEPAARDAQANFQGFVGVLELDDQRGDFPAISDSGVDIDFSNLPVAGLEAEYAFYQGWVHAGLNPGGSIAWKSEDVRVFGAFTQQTGGVLAVTLDNSLLLFELHLGGYVRGRLHERITAYGAAGPMLLFGHLDVEDQSVSGGEQMPDLEDTDSSDINVGYYARAGVDFEFRDGQHFGLGVRYIAAEMDFSETVGSIDIEGPQYLLTFTRRL